MRITRTNCANMRGNPPFLLLGMSQRRDCWGIDWLVDQARDILHRANVGQEPETDDLNDLTPDRNAVLVAMAYCCTDEDLWRQAVERDAVLEQILCHAKADRVRSSVRLAEMTLAFLNGWRRHEHFFGDIGNTEITWGTAPQRAQDVLMEEALGPLVTQGMSFLGDWEAHPKLRGIRRRGNHGAPALGIRDCLFSRTRAMRCKCGSQTCKRSHHIDDWNAKEEKGESLTAFLREGVLGDSGDVKPGALNTGLLLRKLRIGTPMMPRQVGAASWSTLRASSVGTARGVG